MPRLGINITHQALSSYFKNENNKVLNEHLEKIHSLWGDKYNLSIDNLRESYNDDWIHIHIEKLENKKQKRLIQKVQEEEYKKNVENSIKDEDRCRARIWNDPPLVYYDKENHKWIIGERCKRKSKDGHLCGIHLKSLPHGTIDEEPPHNRFEKYKKIWTQKN